MIRKEGLRIGNLVNYHNFNNDNKPRYFKIRDIFFEDGKIGLTDGRIQLPCTNLEFIKPILLTRDLLLDCGYYFDPNSFAFVDKGGVFPYLTDYYGSGGGYNFMGFKPMVYLHELQNTMYHLTGKELTINL